ncbi:MAG: hypothetical protein A2Z48_07815 [Actinobacteria bacterium RBG_19FT_COMBO_70_19]|nr:MAG: hypothetical protein A2Z48_07815 [Actinobacteria bacterium RBG_19FT_COMBO_70_19]
MFVRAGSVRTIATSRGSSATASASGSLKRTTFVRAVTFAGRPASSGTRFPSSSSSTSASSKCPWYLPSNMRTLSRPVNTLETRIVSVFAWLAESVYCHIGRP